MSVCYGRDVQWECKADLPDTLRFGATDVSCEGYANRNDPYVLVGSCGVEYELRYTEKGKREKKKKDRGNSWFGDSYDYDYGVWEDRGSAYSGTCVST